MNKIIMGLAIIGFIGFFAIQQAYAGRGRNMNSSPGCPAWDCGNNQSQNNTPQKDIDAFLQATVDLRKHLAMKQAEYQALMNSDNPDPAKAGAITGEMFQLRDQIRTKAKEAGVGNGYCGAGYGCRGGWGNGFGPGGGRGYCRGFNN
jgi:zinc resistance-associated protein